MTKVVQLVTITSEQHLYGHMTVTWQSPDPTNLSCCRVTSRSDYMFQFSQGQDEGSVVKILPPDTERHGLPYLMWCRLLIVPHFDDNTLS